MRFWIGMVGPQGLEPWTNGLKVTGLGRTERFPRSETANAVGSKLQGTFRENTGCGGPPGNRKLAGLVHQAADRTEFGVGADRLFRGVGAGVAVRHCQVRMPEEQLDVDFAGT